MSCSRFLSKVAVLQRSTQQIAVVNDDQLTCANPFGNQGSGAMVDLYKYPGWRPGGAPAVVPGDALAHFVGIVHRMHSRCTLRPLAGGPTGHTMISHGNSAPVRCCRRPCTWCAEEWHSEFKLTACRNSPPRSGLMRQSSNTGHERNKQYAAVISDHV